MRYAVIGGGPAGCAAAFELQQRGHEVVLLEKAAAVGGRTTTFRGDDGRTVLDTGAGFFTDFYPLLHSLLQRCGLQHEAVELPRCALLVWHGRVAPLRADSLASLVTFPFLTWRERWAVGQLGAQCMVRYRDLDLGNAASLATCDDMSVASFAHQHVGRAVYDFLIRPAIEPYWYFSCEEVSRALLCVLLARAAASRFYTMKRGMDSICHALTKQIKCRTRCDVQSVRVQDDGVVVRSGDRDERFDGAVVATPATVAQRLTTGVRLAPASRVFLETQTYVPSIHVAFSVPRGVAQVEASSVFPCGPGHAEVAAVSFNSAKQQGTATDTDLISVFLASTACARLAGERDAEVAAWAWPAARRLYRHLPEQATLHSVHARHEAIPVHGVGRFRLAAQFLQQQHGPVVFAGDYLATATVEGALSTGMQAAAALGRGAGAMPAAAANHHAA